MAWVQRMLEPIRARGASIDAVLAGAGIPPRLLDQAASRVTGDQYAALFRLLMVQFGDECLGFLSRPLKLGSFALMARYCAGARNLGQAMHRGGQVLGLLQDDFVLELARARQLAGMELVFSNPVTGQRPFLHDMLLRVLWQFYVWLAGGRLRAVRFDLAYPCPHQQQGYSDVFPGPTRFGCRRSAVWFDAAWLEAPVRRSEAALRAYLADAQRNIILPRHFNDAMTARVREHLRHRQPAWPGLAATAAALHMSTATLQRRLADENTSFRGLVNELRRDLAINSLVTGRTNTHALAQELGFADVSAFLRAFKRWTGRTPGSYCSETMAPSPLP